MKITNIIGRQVLDSRGNPTIEVDLYSGKVYGRAIVPSGASTGVHEALELRDNGKSFFGKSVHNAVRNVNILKKHLIGIKLNQEKLDNLMLSLDGTSNKSKFGANTILGISMAFARCQASVEKKLLFQVLGNKKVMPIPFANIINGGKHAAGKLAMQEFMIVPKKAKSFTQATEQVSETYHLLKNEISKKYGKSATHVGDEGGFAPPLKNAEEALNLIQKAIDKSGYKLSIAMDAAASEFYKKGKYNVGKTLSKDELVDYYLRLIKKYKIISLEDPFDQDDYEPWKELTKKSKIQIVGDDLLVTNKDRITMALKNKLCNSLLLKVNQIGTVTEAIQSAKLSMKNKWNVMVSHRSGETEDTFISDLSIALGCGQIKLGAPCRGERTAKYNQLLRIEESLKRIKYGF